MKMQENSGWQETTRNLSYVFDQYFAEGSASVDTDYTLRRIGRRPFYIDLCQEGGVLGPYGKALRHQHRKLTEGAVEF